MTLTKWAFWINWNKELDKLEYTKDDSKIL